MAQRYELLLNSEHTNEGQMEMCHLVVFPASPLCAEGCHVHCSRSTIPGPEQGDSRPCARLPVEKGAEGTASRVRLPRRRQATKNHAFSKCVPSPAADLACVWVYIL